MSFPDERRRNDEYGWIEEAAAALLAASRDLVGRGEAARVSDAAVAQIMTAAIRLYVAKSDGEERTFRPVAGRKDEDIDRDRSAVGDLGAAARAAARTHGARAVVSPPPR